MSRPPFPPSTFQQMNPNPPWQQQQQHPPSFPHSAQQNFASQQIQSNGPMNQENGGYSNNTMSNGMPSYQPSSSQAPFAAPLKPFTHQPNIAPMPPQNPTMNRSSLQSPSASSSNLPQMPF